MKYYFSDGKDKFGPMTAEEAANRVRNNPGGRNFIWKPGMEHWAKPHELSEIASLLASPEETVPAPDTSGAAAMSSSTEPQGHTPEPEEAFDLPPRHTTGTAAAYKEQQSIVYPKADVAKRLLAYIIDSLIATVFLIPSVITLIAAFNDADLLFPFLALSFVLIFPPFIYALIRDGLGNGQSWGKQLMGLMVVDMKSNTPCNKSKSFVRHLVGALPSLFPYLGWLVEPVIVLADDKGRRLGDRAADTMVINQEAFTGISPKVRGF